jgi:hypothetical protein
MKHKTPPFTNEECFDRMGKSAKLWLPEILVRWICQEGQFQDEALLVLKDIEGIGIIYHDKGYCASSLVKKSN